MPAASGPRGHDTLPLKVANTGFLLDRLGMDCDNLQFLRELTQNAIEAILRTAKQTGEIVWDVDWLTLDLEGFYKLSVTDNGDGMTGENMVDYINQLSSSSGIQSHVANYGVGAKIAAATRNPAGLTYISWNDQKGYMVHLWRDPASGDYGLRQLQRPDGTFGHWAAISDDKEIKPEIIQGHGTKVVLHGTLPDSNTMAAPEGAPSPSRWVTRYLNARYFRFPEGITVRCREGWEFDRSDKDRNVLRTVAGQQKYLESHAQSSGKVKLSNALVRWWILKDEPALTQNSGFVASSGHCAALWKDELYEMTSGRGNTAMLQGFGIIFGYQRVVLYVEPFADGLTSNTARTVLLINNKPLPWPDWQEEFREQMPIEIVKLMEAVAAASAKSDHANSIRERLKQIEELFKFSRYRPQKTGTLLVSEDSRAAGGSVREGERQGGRKGERSSDTAGQGSGQAPSVYALFLSPTGVPGDTAKPDIYPKVDWITVADGTRVPGDMEDRAARYLQKDNRILINSDFRLFKDMIKRWTSQFANVPGAEAVVQEVVREWFEQSLIETVLSANAMRGSQFWSQQHIDALLSEEGLTAAVLPRYHIDYSIKRTLGSKLGAIKPKAA